MSSSNPSSKEAASESKETKPAPAPQPAAVAPQPAKKRSPKLIIGVVLGVVVLFFAGRALIESMSIVSTDDAYVNSHVTFVAPRVEGQVAKVLVDDNNRVHAGQLLVALDPEPYQKEVDIKQAAVDVATADVVAADASVHALIGQTRSARFKLDQAIDQVHNQVALVHANVASLDSAKATLTLAQEEFDRAKKLLESKVTSSEEFDQKQAALSVAKAQYNQALENVHESRVALGLPVEPENGGDLAQIPDKVDQTAPAVRAALGELMQDAAQLNVTTSSYNLTPEEVIKEFYNRDPSHDIDKIYEQIIKDAPTIKQAQAKLESAQKDLAQAQLNLSYCNIVSEIDGVVTRRNVNPGNNVQVGQSLMAVRSLNEIWVDANFKETQLSKLRIGQPVDLETDVYGTKKTFKGRISGFTMGTGSTLALLPAQNATGNFVKVVQRLPVRIDVLDYDPDKDILFVGTSVTPKVHIRDEPTGPNAGGFLQPYTIQPAVTSGSTSVGAQTRTANP